MQYTPKTRTAASSQALDKSSTAHSDADADRLSVLVVSEGAKMAGAMIGAVDARGVRFVELEDLAAALSLEAADVVLSPLVSDAFDCFDVAARLAELGFSGRYRAASGHIPDPGLVRREVRATYPKLDFELVVLDEPDGTLLN